MAQQDSEQPAEQFRRGRREHGAFAEHGGFAEHIDDDRLARPAEEERVSAGIDDYDADEVPPATDASPRWDVTSTDEYPQERPRFAASSTRMSCRSRERETLSRRRAMTGEASRRLS
ncbi:MAG TPA: hypothetical protein VLW50_31705 [Streptosporangiaceae bacterium]|nr:hypothetical protein [Streptosporangiaceae bacterium]